MTKEEIIKLAREQGSEVLSDPEGVEYFFYQEELIAFVAAVIKHEQHS
jgi:bifunctional ADP-heptose synthase (sugar kinase/adenylyltransferase)